MNKTVLCPKCGQKNKIKGNVKRKRCEKCWFLIEEEKKHSSNSWVFWLLISIIVIIFLNQNLSFNKENNYPQVPMPYSGQEQKFVNDKSIAPLTIQTSRGVNYLVKIVDYYSKSNIMTIFIKGGDTIKTKVPLGIFEIRYASGKQWYGYEHLFGKNTSYAKAEQRFYFSNTGYKITGYTLNTI